ncbi:MAG: trk/ktr system potassium uptake protein [Pseudonocardiales bacterium]|jgi:trk system potassium uptake protein TrkA|nr:trk/ktr system potassium uptake protein [Pseudonocardiales bacterium]
MRVAIAGAGKVGQAIARSLIAAGHRVLLIESQRRHFRPSTVPAADWMFADATELDTLNSAGIGMADVVIAATGDDQANLVFAMLCKQEFGVNRVVARVNEPGNGSLFTTDWGVDVAASTPHILTVAIEAAVLLPDLDDSGVIRSLGERKTPES